MVDLLAALQRSVERHKKAGPGNRAGSEDGQHEDEKPKARTRPKTDDSDKTESKPATRRRSPARKTG